MENKVVIISGPTASGKTSLAVKLAEKLESEIISADSRQVYKYLDIGTAKPSKEQLTQVKHHFIDTLYPDQEYNVSIYEKEAESVINRLLAEDKIPVVVGGSGLYIKAIVDGIFEGPSKDENIRQHFNKLREEKGNEYIYEILKQKDPESAAKMTSGHWKRIIRALEVLELTGKTIGQFHSEQQQKSPVKEAETSEQETKTNPQYFLFNIERERVLLYSTIESRVDDMIADGLEAETRKVLDMGYPASLNSLNTVGYKEMIEYICGSISFDRCIELIKRNTRRYAKRQMTWIRGEKRFIPLTLGEKENIDFILDTIN